MARGLSLALGALVLMLGCSDEDPPTGEGPDPTPGGTTPTASPPAGPMDDMEKPIAEKLGHEVAAQGLHVDHLDCPAWDGQVPAELTCTGWFDNVRGTVSVTLTREPGGAVAFDAMLRRGVIATKNLVAELKKKGYDEVDCGAAPAYPTEVGSTITCAVSRGGERKFVTVTVRDRQGGVTITDF